MLTSAKYLINRINQCFHANITVLWTFAESFYLISCVIGGKMRFLFMCVNIPSMSVDRIISTVIAWLWFVVFFVFIFWLTIQFLLFFRTLSQLLSQPQPIISFHFPGPVPLKDLLRNWVPFLGVFWAKVLYFEMHIKNITLLNIATILFKLSCSFVNWKLIYLEK